MNKNRLIVPLLVGVLSSSVLQAQVLGKDSTTYQLQQVEIQASRLPEVKTNAAASVTVIDGKQIQQMSQIVPDMSHLLGLLTPSLALSSNTTSSRSQTLRGRSVLVLIDGIPQSTPLRATDREMRTIDPSAVERVEVIKGSNAIYGNGAIGGIINIVTKANKTAKPFGGYTALAGTTYNFFAKPGANGYRLNQQVYGRVGQLSYLLDAVLSHSPTAVDGAGQYISPRYGLGDTRTLNGLAKLSYDIDARNKVELMYNYYRSLQSTDLVPQGGKYLERPTIGIKGERHPEAVSEGTRYNHNAYLKFSSRGIFPHTNLEASLFASSIYTIFDFREANPKSPRWEERSGQSSVKDAKLGLRTQLVTKLRLSPHIYTNILYGYDFLRNTTSQALVDGRYWVPELTSYNNAPFVQTKTTLFEHLHLKLGARYDLIAIDVPDYKVLRNKLSDPEVAVKAGRLQYQNFSFNAGLAYNKYKVFQPFVAYSQGFSIFDLGRTLRATKTPDVLSTISVEPVRTDNYEFGFYSELAKRVQLSASTFYTYSHLGSDLKIENGFWVVNRVPQQVYGVELSADAQVLYNLSVGASYVWLEGRTKEQGKDWDGYMSNLSIPAPKFSLHLSYQPTKRSYLSLQYVHTGERKRFSPNAKGLYNEGEGIVQSINVFNLNAGLNLNKLSLNLGIENLLNNSYYTPASMLMARDAEYARANGRYVTLTATYKY